jgi:flagellar biosynthesis protein FliQ
MSILILGMFIGFIKAIMDLQDSRSVYIPKTNNLIKYTFNTKY